MKKLTVSLFATLFMLSCTEKPLHYPQAKKEDVKDTYFGTVVDDPYRWLENDTSAETAEWVKAENKLTFDYLAKLPYRAEIRKRLTELWDYPKFGTPFKEAGKYFTIKTTGCKTRAYFI